MSSTVRGYNIRDLTQHAKPEIGRLNANVGKVLPATATGNLFTVVGSIAVTGLVGVVETALSTTAVHVSLGVTGSNAAIAANPAAALASTAIGSVLTLPAALGGVLPAPLAASESVSQANHFVVSNTIITVTTDATNTGAITWLLSWVPLWPKLESATVTND